MRWRDTADLSCSLARGLAVIGDRWTMLVLREAFFAARRFEEFQGYTGASAAVVADRLARLVREGVLVKRPYQERPRRHEYRLTDKGRALYPAMIAISHWGEQWCAGADHPPAVTLRHRGCGALIRPVLVCPDCGERLGPGDTVAELGPAFRAERRRLAAAAGLVGPDPTERRRAAAPTETPTGSSRPAALPAKRSRA